MVKGLKGRSLEERVARLQELLTSAREGTLELYREQQIIAWIYHHSVLEGEVYSEHELRGALAGEEPEDAFRSDYDDIRNHKVAIELIHEMAERKRLSINLETIKKIYGILDPESAEGKGAPNYRKEIPLHRLYFHDIAPPEKISYRLRNAVQWMNSSETKRSMHTVRLAARAHYELLQVYPFPRHSGKVARLVMNLILLHNGYPPAIIHATERQRYYEVLKTSADATSQMVTEALGASVESTIQFLELQRRA